MTPIDRVSATLAAAQIHHALIGAAALAARGLARSTFDIDLMVVDTRVLDRSLWAPLEAPGFDVDIRRGDLDDPLAGVVRVQKDGERPIDIIVGKTTWQHRAVARAEAIGNGPPVVQARDLVLLKLYAGGTQDLWDVRELLAVDGAEALKQQVSDDLDGLPDSMMALWRQVVP
jgi:hypothetical protein